MVDYFLRVIRKDRILLTAAQYSVVNQECTEDGAFEVGFKG